MTIALALALALARHDLVADLIATGCAGVFTAESYEPREHLQAA